MVRSLSNLLRLLLELIVNAVIAVIFQQGIGGALFPLTRKCRKCRTTFVEPSESRRPREKLDQCRKCEYSLTGNVSGVCPECGWKLTRAHKRYVKKEDMEPIE